MDPLLDRCFLLRDVRSHVVLRHPYHVDDGDQHPVHEGQLVAWSVERMNEALGAMKVPQALASPNPVRICGHQHGECGAKPTVEGTRWSLGIDCVGAAVPCDFKKRAPRRRLRWLPDREYRAFVLVGGGPIACGITPTVENLRFLSLRGYVRATGCSRGGRG